MANFMLVLVCIKLHEHFLQHRQNKSWDCNDMAGQKLRHSNLNVNFCVVFSRKCSRVKSWMIISPRISNKKGWRFSCSKRSTQKLKNSTLAATPKLRDIMSIPYTAWIDFPLNFIPWPSSSNPLFCPHNRMCKPLPIATSHTCFFCTKSSKIKFEKSSILMA